MRRLSPVFWLIGLSLISVSCDDITDGNKRLQKSTFIPIKDGVQFTIKETYDEGLRLNAPVNPFIQLKMQTEDIFSCLGYSIATDSVFSSSAFHIDIKGVEKPKGACPAALGPASNRFTLDFTRGTYTLNFKYEDSNYPYQLTVTDTSLQISGDTTSFIKPKLQTFWRYPSQSFVYLCSSTPDTRWMCNHFETLMNDSLEIRPFNFPDFGIKPYPSAGKNHDLATYYRYPQETVFQHAGKMLEAYADSVVSQQDGAYLSIISWKNQGFRSWTDVGE